MGATGHPHALDPSLAPDIQINSKWTQDSDVRAETIKLLGKKTVINLCDSG